MHTEKEEVSIGPYRGFIYTFDTVDQNNEFYRYYGYMIYKDDFKIAGMNPDLDKMKEQIVNRIEEYEGADS